MYVMKLKNGNSKRVYVQAIEGPGRKRSRSITVEGWTTAKVIRVIRDAYRREQAQDKSSAAAP